MDLNTKLEGVKFDLTYTVSSDEEAKKAKEGVKYTTTLDFSDLTLGEALTFACEQVKIRQLATRLRKDPKADVSTHKVTKPGVRTSAGMSDETMMRKLTEKFGSVEAVIAALKERAK